MNSTNQITPLKTKIILMTVAAISLNLFITLILVTFFVTINQTRLIILLITFLILALFILLWSIIFYKEFKDQNEQRLQAQAELKNNLELKQLFISIMNHDLNHPLTIIKLAADTLKDQSNAPENLKHLNKIEETVDSMTQLINDAHILSQLEDKQYPKQKTEIDLTILINKIITDFKHRNYNGKKVKIDFSCSEKDCKIEALSILENVFMNLIDNAIKYSGKTAIIKINIVNKKNNYIISVADNGIGVPDEYKEKVFLRYQRLNKKGIAGTGLGLSIVQHIVAIHNGKVWIEDGKTGGAVFKIQLPKR